MLLVESEAWMIAPTQHRLRVIATSLCAHNLLHQLSALLPGHGSMVRVRAIRGLGDDDFPEHPFLILGPDLSAHGGGGGDRVTEARNPWW